MPERVVGAASIKLYDQGAEGYPIENGFDLYDIPAPKIWHETEYSSSNRKPWLYDVSSYTPFTGYRKPSVMALEELSVACPAPTMVQYDLETADFNFFGGEWEELAPLQPPRKTRVVQYSVEENVVVRAESLAILPANSNISFSIERLGSHVENDETNYPSKVQVVLGDKYQVRFSDGEDAGIWIKRAGLWVHEHPIGLTGKGDEIFVWVIVRRGVVLFSFDFGKEWQPVYGTDADLTIPAGQIIAEGVSCQFSIGLQQLYFPTCWYDTYELPVLENHLGSPYVNLTQSYKPLLTNISLAFLSSNPGTVRYRVTFDSYEKIVSNLPFNLYDVPELYATMIGWPTILFPAAGSYVDLTTLGVIKSIEISEDEEISQRSGSLALDADSMASFSGNYGRRLIDVDLGYILDDGTNTLTNRCMMYALEVTPQANNDFQSEIQFDLVDLYIRAHETKVDGGWKPLDGMSPSDARDYVLYKMGWPTSRRSWYSSSAANLPNGLPDNPLWWPPEGITAADIFAALDLWEGTETFVANDGTLSTRLFHYYSGSTDFTFQGLGVSKDLRVIKASLRANHRDAKTAIIVASSDYRHGNVWATYIDYALERSPATSGFIGYRIWEKYDETGVATLAQAAYLLDMIRSTLVTIPYDLEEEVPGCPNIYRGNVIANSDTTMIGVSSLNQFRVAALSFNWGHSLGECRTTIRARRI